MPSVRKRIGGIFVGIAQLAFRFFNEDTFVNNPMLFVNKAHLSLLYRSLICAISPFKGNYSFPVWEY